MDILGELPFELSLDILDFLCPRDLAKCLGISSRWRSRANSDYLWRKFCLKEEWTEAEEANFDDEADDDCELEVLCFWARIYSCVRRTIMKNWMTNNHRRYLIDPSSWSGPRSPEWHHKVLGSSADLLVIGDPSASIDLYSIMSTPAHLGNLKPPLEDTPVLGLAVTPRYLVVHQDNALFFLDRRRNFRVTHCVIVDVESHRSLVFPWDRDFLSSASELTLPVEYFTAIGDFVYVEISTGVFQIDARGSQPKETVAISFFSTRRLYKDNNFFYILEDDLLTILNPQGTKYLCLDFPAQSITYRFFSNRNIFLVLCKALKRKKASHLFVAYDLQTGIKISETPSWKPYGYELHPEWDLLVYATSEVVACRDLRSGNLMWEIDSLVPSGTLARVELSFVTPSLLVALPRADWELFNRLLVIEFRQGRLLYALQIEACSLLQATDRMVAYLAADDKIEVITFR